MSNRLLFVCAMNVCRSPLMAYTFAEALASDGGGDEWSVSSRGTSVTRRDAMCDTSASLISDSESGAAFAAGHVSAPISAPQLTSQDLILVASRSERAKLATMSPSMRQRTFTLREAVLLGRAPVTAAEIALITRTRASNQKVRLGGYHQLLHLRRGTIAMPAPRRGSLFRRDVRQPDPIDLPDVHHEKQARHEGVLKESQADVRALHEQLRSFLDARAKAA